MPGIDVCAELGEGTWSRADREGVLRNLQRARLDTIVLSSRRALAGELAAGNAELKSAIEGQPALLGWVVVSPSEVEGSAQELRRYASARNFVGARLDARASGQRLYGDAALEILNGFRRFAKPALVTVRDEGDIQGLERLAREITSIKFIAGGAGGEAWQACGLMAKRVVNVLVEPFTGGSHAGKIEALVTLLGAHRLLFATGYPELSPGAALGALADAQIGEGEKQGILKNNAARLLSLTET